MHNDIKVVATATGILSDKTLGVGLINSFLKLQLLVPELTTYVDVRSLGPHTEADDESTLNKLVRVMSEDLSVLASAWLGLIRIDHQV